uniref:Uncharacterized protein n=1 Tax=Aegilops tauschii subsp. strangulata TaxID=200361 RepID=A0A453A7S2_AEGTS
MEAAGDEETPLLHHHPPSGLYQNGDSRLNTCDATVDVNGQPAAKASTGNWRACFFILGKTAAAVHRLNKCGRKIMLSNNSHRLTCLTF